MKDAPYMLIVSVKGICIFNNKCLRDTKNNKQKINQKFPNKGNKNIDIFTNLKYNIKGVLYKTSLKSKASLKFVPKTLIFDSP